MPQPRSSDAGLDSSAWRTIARRRLLAWYRRNARQLPWRETSDPYAIWISEIMLQQTQVATVIPYFLRFMVAFPTVAALAAAREEAVLRFWEGLGYYRRARQLHAAAKKIVKEHGGEFPQSRDAILALPGIGRYTAGAVMSIAFDACEPILEANTIRLLSRLTEFRGDPISTTGKTLLWDAAKLLLPSRGCGTFNQALMEVGSLICTPRNPNCAECPLASLCPTNQKSLQNSIPAPARQPQIEEVREVAIILSRADGAVLLRKCAVDERWAGLWDFPRFKLKKRADDLYEPPSAASLRQLLELQLRMNVGKVAHFTMLRHQVTRFKITLDCFTASLVDDATVPEGKTQWRWVQPAQFTKYPLSVTGRKLARLWSEQSKRRHKRKRPPVKLAD